MKINKFFYSILFGFLAFVGFSSADCIIYGPSNEVLMMYPCESGVTEITLDGDRTRNGSNFTYTDGFDGTTVYYSDGEGQSHYTLLTSDIYFNGTYTIGYTGTQYLDLTNTSCKQSNPYIPVFEVTGGIQEVSESGNIFNNFAENSVKFTLSNIPSYIQYVIILFILFFILGFIRKFRRK